MELEAWLSNRDKICAAVLLKPPGFAKSRLSHLDGPVRERLALAMAEDILEEACSCEIFDAVWLVGSDPVHMLMAERNGAVPIAEGSPKGLNGAAALALETARLANIRWCVLLPGDIPLADSKTLQNSVQLLIGAMERAGQSIGLVPCRRDEGTNLMICDTAIRPIFSYGPGSFQRHVALSEGAQILRDSRLGLDIDEMADLVELSRRVAMMGSPPVKTAAVLCDALRKQECGHDA